MPILLIPKILFILLKILLILKILLLILLVSSLPLAAQTDSAQLARLWADSVFSVADVAQPPLFEGCDDALISGRQQQKCSQERLAAFIGERLQYPDSARARGTEGLVVVRLIINSAGEVQQAELLHDAGDFCGREALRLSRLLPRFAPARHANGVAVNCFLLLPVRFSLNKTSVSSYDDDYRLHWGSVYGDSLNGEQLQQLLEFSPQVRDHFGNTFLVRRIEISLIRGSKIETEIARADVPSKNMRRRFARPSVGSTLVLKVEAENAESGERIPLLREYTIVPTPKKRPKRSR